ncbi:MAG TPA: TetR/AcrR family transcriptional regulator [Edaphobacter sp.]
MPISDCEVRDPRIRRTRQLLQGALRDLMKTKALDEISVQDITDLATVNRATFYDHYNDKFALHEAMVAGGFHKLLHERNVLFDGTCPSAASAIILAACDYLTHIHTGDCTRHNAFEPLMESAMVSAIRRVLIEGLGKHPNPSLPPEMIATTAAWAIYGAVKQWFYTPNHASAEESVQSILQLIAPILQTAGPMPSHTAPPANQESLTPQ